MGDAIFELLATAIEDLDTVIIEDVMGCGDHDSAIKSVSPGDVGNARRGRNMKDIGIRARGGDAGR